jgi:hypothetical protein
LVRCEPSPQELVDNSDEPSPDDPWQPLKDQEERDIKKAMARSIQGAPEPDDLARLDAKEESELMKAVALSIQDEEERQQHVSHAWRPPMEMPP